MALCGDTSGLTECAAARHNLINTTTDDLQPSPPSHSLSNLPVLDISPPVNHQAGRINVTMKAKQDQSRKCLAAQTATARLLAFAGDDLTKGRTD